MMLSVWTHPTTGATRIYYNDDWIGSLKIWFEKDGEDYAAIKINAFGTSIARNRTEIDRVMDRVDEAIREAGIDANSWTALLAAAQGEKK